MNLTANQCCAFRLTLARISRGWSQEEACERLAQFGLNWSVPVLSAAERSVTGSRTRRFDADEIVALALCFRYPVAWWYCPPGPDPYGLAPTISPRAGRTSLTPEDLADALTLEYPTLLFALLAAEGLSPAMRARIARLHSPEPPEEEGT